MSTCAVILNSSLRSSRKLMCTFQASSCTVQMYNKSISSEVEKETIYYNRFIIKKVVKAAINKKAQLSLTNPRDACEKFARFT